MIVVVIAGGSGTRLWPLSTHEYPKHLLSLFDDKSLLQNTVERVLQVTSKDKVFVVPEVSHVAHVREQLPDIDEANIIVEPGRRGTASCIILALSEIKKRGFADEPVAFLWADHLIRDVNGFTATMLKASAIADDRKQLVFIGVEPTYPSTGLGYMERDGELEGWADAYEFAGFKEKPDKTTAESFLAAGRYFWNTGYLVGCLSTFEHEMQTHNKRLWGDYQQLQTTKDIGKTYLAFEPDAIDYALSEKVTKAVVVAATFDWADVGSFKDLHDMSFQNDAGNHTTGDKVELEDTTNSYVRNDSDLPVAVIGLDNIVVVASKNGIVVANKNFAQKVGDVAKRLQQK